MNPLLRGVSVALCLAVAFWLGLYAVLQLAAALT